MSHSSGNWEDIWKGINIFWRFLHPMCCAGNPLYHSICNSAWLDGSADGEARVDSEFSKTLVFWRYFLQKATNTELLFIMLLYKSSSLACGHPYGLQIEKTLDIEQKILPQKYFPLLFYKVSSAGWKGERCEGRAWCGLCQRRRSALGREGR